jgi:DUF4097 and DUF4098 domain-containing protein YvlB
MWNRRTAVRITLAAALVVLGAGAGWAGKDWKEIPNPDERMFEQEFPVGEGARLRVNVSDVDVQLVQAEGGTARVEIYATGRDRDEAREYYDKLHFSVTGDDNTITVQTRQSSIRVSFWNWSSSRVNVRAVITIPPGTDMHVKTSDGDIRAGELAGRLEARTSDGDVMITAVDGPAVLLRSSDGDVRVDRIHGDEVEARTSDGDVRVRSAAGKELTFSTSDGDVRVEEAEADAIYLKTSDGDIDVTATAGKVRAHTSDGDIRVTLTGETQLDLVTSDGDIAIRVPQTMGATVDLRGEHVRLTGGIDIQGDVSSHRVRGTLGKGGMEITARTSDGSVTLERR